MSFDFCLEPDDSSGLEGGMASVAGVLGDNRTSTGSGQVSSGTTRGISSRTPRRLGLVLAVKSVFSRLRDDFCSLGFDGFGAAFFGLISFSFSSDSDCFCFFGEVVFVFTFSVCGLDFYTRIWMGVRYHILGPRGLRTVISSSRSAVLFGLATVVREA